MIDKSQIEVGIPKIASANELRGYGNYEGVFSNLFFISDLNKNFKYDPTDTTSADDGDTVIVNTITGRRYKVVIDPQIGRIVEERVSDRLPYLSISQVQNLDTSYFTEIYVTDTDKEGAFAYDNADTSTPNDGVLVLVDKVGRRYKRVLDGPVNAKWWGIKADGATDYFTQWDTMLNNPLARDILVPYAIQPYVVKNIKLKSNTTLTLEAGVVIKGIGKGWDQEIIQITKSDNIVINGEGAILDGNRYAYDIDSEFFGGIGIRQGNNITINGLTIKHCNGDGVYLGRRDYDSHNKNIKLNGLVIDDISRNGISVIDADGLWIENCSASNADGKFPECGIDIEPNGNNYLVKGVRITNFKSANCTGGILVALRALGNSLDNVDIIIDNHVDDGSNYGFLVGSIKNTVKGDIIVNNSIWRNNLSCPFLVQEYSSNSPRVEVNDPKVYNPMVSGIPYLGYTSAFLIMRGIGSDTQNALGNIHIRRPSIIEERTSDIPNYVGFTYVDRENTGNHYFENCTIEDPIRLDVPDKSRAIVARHCTTFPLISDKYNVCKLNITDQATATVSQTPTTVPYYYKTFNNKLATVDTTITVGIVPDGTILDFEVDSSTGKSISVNLNSARPLYPYKLSSLKSSTTGSRITIMRDSTLGTTSGGGYRILSVEGVWEDLSGNILANKSNVRVQEVSNTGVALASPDVIVYANNSTASTTVWLPPVAQSKGGTVRVIRVTDHNPARFLRVQGDGSDLIDGVNIRTLSVKGEYYVLTCDGTQWRIVEHGGNHYSNFINNTSYGYRPTKGILNAAYGDRPQGFTVNALNILSGAERYEKLTSAPDSDWSAISMDIITTTTT